MTTPVKIDHIKEGLARLPYQWGDEYNYTDPSEVANATVVQRLLQSYLEGLQSIEDDAFDVRDAFNLFTATGQRLDFFGVIFQKQRSGRSDKQYRIELLKTISAVNISGTIDEILDLIQSLTGSDTLYLWEHYPAGYIAGVESKPDRSIPEYVKLATAAGVDGGYIIFDYTGDCIVPQELTRSGANLNVEQGITEDNLTTESGDNLVVSTLVAEGSGDRGIFPDESEGYVRPLATVAYLDTVEPDTGGWGLDWGYDYGGS